jgi:hypothetical protein
MPDWFVSELIVSWASRVQLWIGSWIAFCGATLGLDDNKKATAKAEAEADPPPSAKDDNKKTTANANATATANATANATATANACFSASRGAGWPLEWVAL